MSDGEILFIKPPFDVAEALFKLNAWWSITDVEGGNPTKAHGRGRNIETPLTGACGKITCWPEGTESDQRKGVRSLAYELSFYAPASLIGNNLFPQNLVRVPAEAALAWWKGYMRRRYGHSPVLAQVLDRITLADCQLGRITAVYLWKFESPEAALVFHERLRTHCKAYLDKDLRRCEVDALGRSRPRKYRVRDDGHDGDTFYVDLPWGGQLRCYIKVRDSKRAFCLLEGEVKDEMFTRAACIVRAEVEVDVAKFRSAQGDVLPVCPANWNRDNMADPYELIWEAVREELALDGSLAKHDPTERLSSLPEAYREVAAAHLKGEDLRAACPDDKMRSRIINRLRRSEGRLWCYLPWQVQKSETWSSWLEAKTRYADRFRPELEPAVSQHSLTEANVHSRAEALARLA